MIEKLIIRSACKFHTAHLEPCPVCLRERLAAEKKEKEYLETQRWEAEKYHEEYLLGK